MITATPTTLSLTEPYAREIVTHILASRATTIMEETTVTDSGIPYVDEMILNGFNREGDDFLTRAAELGTLCNALPFVADVDNDSFDWPLGTEALSDGAGECVRTLRERLTEVPVDRIEEFGRAIQAAESFADRVAVTA